MHRSQDGTDARTDAARPDSEATAPTLPAEAAAQQTLLNSMHRYRVREVLGRGGMGVVELCRDERIQRDVARKSMLPEVGDAAGRFLREALVQARLEHPVFVPVYEIEPEGPAFTMRRVRGRSLRDVMRERAGHDSQPRLLRALVELCLALDFAHSRGVVHRDIKPENIMLGDFGEVYLIDWGIARVQSESDDAILPASSSSEGTRVGAMLGTPGYMPPEQVRGDHANVDARSDVYALGATLYEILAGSPMHTGDGVVELIESTLDARERRPSERRPDVPAELDQIVARATAFEPANRFPGTRAMAREIERYLDGERDVRAKKSQAARLAADSRDLLSKERTASNRVAAGRRASTALALDPGNDVAREALVEALTNIDENPTPAALEAADRLRSRSEAETAREFGRALVAFTPLSLGALALAGIRNAVAVAMFLGLNALSGVLLATLQPGRKQERRIQIGFAVLCLANAIGTRWSSPWITVPMAMLGNVLIICLHATPLQRRIVSAMALATVVVPALLDETKLIAPSYETIGGDIVIHPRFAGIPTWMLFIYYVLLIVTGGRVLWKALDHSRRVEAQMQTVAITVREIATPEPSISPIRATVD